jgi:hypothetical protein
MTAIVNTTIEDIKRLLEDSIQIDQLEVVPSRVPDNSSNLSTFPVSVFSASNFARGLP